jgi:hypothetical protein
MRTFTVSITTITFEGQQVQTTHGPYASAPSRLDEEVACLVDAKARRHENSQWHIAIIAGSDYGFIIQKYNGDGTFANEMVDGEL